MAFNISLIWEPDVAVALSHAYNQFMYEEFLKKSPRLKAVALLPLQDMNEAVKELRRAVAELGMVGAMLPAFGLHRPLGRREFFPLYEEAQRLDTVLAVHSGTQGIHHFGADDFQKFIEVHTFCFPVGLLKQMTSMVFAGIPELFPRLRIGWLEAGCGWVPYWLERMDEEWEKRAKVEAPLLKRKPSEYIQDAPWYFHAEADERLVPYVMSVVGEDAILYASDFPHWDAEYPQSIDHILAREDLTETAKRKFLGGNAKALYRLG
jgi:predicted TIM-barrel fold metal-dependent hydrolase